MKPIDKTFRKSGFEYKQVFRDGPWCIYRQTKPGTQIERFEVVKLKIAKATLFMGKEIPEREAYPSSEEWGVRGWTCLDLEAAHMRLKNQLSYPNGQPKDASEGKISPSTAE